MSTSDVFPVLAKRWYGYGDDDWYWQLFSIHGDERTAAAACARLSEVQRRPRSRNNPYEEGRKKEFKYQRNMVI